MFKDDKLQKETVWSSSIGGPGPLTKKQGCGEWRFIAIQNYIEFYLQAGCEIEIRPLDQIRTNIRLNWTLEEFYADGGTTTFTDRVAASLGVPAWRIKTVAVYEGSVIVLFDLLADDSVESPLEELKNLGDKLVEVLVNSKDNLLGAPILDLDFNGQNILSSGDLGTGGNMGTSTLIADWLAERDGTKKKDEDQTDSSGSDDSSNNNGGTSDGTDGGDSSDGTDGGDSSTGDGTNDTGND